MTISNDDEPFLLWVEFVILGLYYVYSVGTERVLVYFRCTCPSYIASLSEVTDLLDEEMAMFSDVEVGLLLSLLMWTEHFPKNFKDSFDTFYNYFWI